MRFIEFIQDHKLKKIHHKNRTILSTEMNTLVHSFVRSFRYSASNSKAYYLAAAPSAPNSYASSLVSMTSQILETLESRLRVVQALILRKQVRLELGSLEGVVGLSPPRRFLDLITIFLLLLRLHFAFSST